MSSYDQWKLASPPEPEPFRCADCGEWDEDCECKDGSWGCQYAQEDYEADRAGTMYGDGRKRV